VAGMWLILEPAPELVSGASAPVTGSEFRSKVTLPRDQLGGFRVGRTVGRRSKVTLPRDQLGGFRVGRTVGRRLKVTLPRDQLGGFRVGRTVGRYFGNDRG
jgi:hypothetical protein